MMNRIIAVAALACVAMLVSAGARAQPRMQAQADFEVTPPAPMDVWLRRLVGSYRFDGVVEVVYPGYRCLPDPSEPDADVPPPDPSVPYCKPITGKGDCIAVGKGPGVQCMFGMKWDDIYEVVTTSDVVPAGAYNLPGGVSNMDPAMILFGIDPGKAGIHYLLVDHKGLPEGGLGFITGNRATFRTSCVNGPSLFLAMKPPPPSSCNTAKPANLRPDHPHRRQAGCGSAAYVDGYRDQRRPVDPFRTHHASPGPLRKNAGCNELEMFPVGCLQAKCRCGEG